MNEKIEVKICTGTLCYVMGGAELQLLEEYLPEELLEKIEISGSPCLDTCHTDPALKAPFALVGEKLISEASITKIELAIREEINFREENGCK